MGYKLGDTIYVDFTTHNPTTGAASDATAVSCQVFENATVTALLNPTPVKRTGQTGDYCVTLPLLAASGFVAGRSYNVIASATVGGVLAKATILTFVLEAYDLTDIRHLVSSTVIAMVDSSTAASGGSPLEMYQGNTKTFTFVCTNASLVAYNITGATAVLTVKEGKDDVALVTKTTEAGGGITLSDPTVGELQVAFTHDDTHLIADANLDRPLIYDLRLTLLTGEVLTVAESTFVIKKTVTAP